MLRRFFASTWWKAARLIIIASFVWIVFAAVKFSRKNLGQNTARKEKTSNVITEVTTNAKQDESFQLPSVYLENIPGISAHEFKYILRPNYDEICGGKSYDVRTENEPDASATEMQKSRKPLLMMILVHSRASHFKHREVIRETWAAEGKKVSKVVFLLGNPLNQSIQQEVENEYARFGDILQEDFYEAYRNITLKAIMGLKWATQFCPRALYVTKCDDDMYVAVKKILSIIINRSIPSRKLILCSPVHHGPVERSGKYAVSKSLYALKIWPDFCFGGCWVASSDVIKNLYEASLMTRQIHLDDVFVTGILRIKSKLKISRTSASSRLFCHGKGNPETVRKFWEQGRKHSRLSTGNDDKWNHCFK